MPKTARVGHRLKARVWSKMMSQPYIGPGIWIRVKHRFGARMMEWFYATHTAAWGGVLFLQ